MAAVVAFLSLLILVSAQSPAGAPDVACASLVPFDTALTALQPGFRGHDLGSVLECGTWPMKDEFETTAQYNARLARLVHLPAVLAFPYDLDQSLRSLRYDADAARFELTVKKGDLKLRDSVSLSHTKLLERTYAGGNAFGAVRTITRIEYRTLGVALPAREIGYRPPELVGWSFQIPIPLERARALKDGIRVLVVCEPDASLGRALVVENVDTLTPTISTPVDYEDNQYYLSVRWAQVWVYDDRTGEILLKADLAPAK